SAGQRHRFAAHARETGTAGGSSKSLTCLRRLWSSRPSPPSFGRGQSPRYALSFVVNRFPPGAVISASPPPVVMTDLVFFYGTLMSGFSRPGRARLEH